MPEGPELYLSSAFVNRVCKGRIFGKIAKSEVSKQPDIDWEEKDGYTISAESRGKETKLTLTAVDKSDAKKSKIQQTKRSLDIMFQFGMSGKFDFYDASSLQKHAHLNFFTRDEVPEMVLSFVDYRRFGKWTPGATWSQDRGPCVIKEYQQFRENVLKNLGDSAFNRSVCEVLLNQKFFNGIGNYLRAEILYRAGIPPFTQARPVFEQLLEQNEDGVKIKSEAADILQLCTVLPNEVINLEGTGYDPEDSKGYSAFTQWLQCYYQPDMKNMADHNRRTIWFAGPAGPMAPKDGKSRAVKRSSKSKSLKTKEGEVKQEQLESLEPGEEKAKRRKTSKVSAVSRGHGEEKGSASSSSLADLKLSVAMATTRLTRGTVKQILAMEIQAKSCVKGENSESSNREAKGKTTARGSRKSLLKGKVKSDISSPSKKVNGVVNDVEKKKQRRKTSLTNGSLTNGHGKLKTPKLTKKRPQK